MDTPLRRSVSLAPKLALPFSTSATVAKARQPLESTRRVRKNPRGSAENEPPTRSEIRFQSKVANSVILIGRVDMPVQFEAAADGKFWAATVISRCAKIKGTNPSSDGPSFSIPVLFEGDLAHVASFHLREKDRVCVEGQSLAEPPPVINASWCQTNVQVMVDTINFVEGSPPTERRPYLG